MDRSLQEFSDDEKYVADRFDELKRVHGQLQEEKEAIETLIRRHDQSKPSVAFKELFDLLESTVKQNSRLMNRVAELDNQNINLRNGLRKMQKHLNNHIRHFSSVLRVELSSLDEAADVVNKLVEKQRKTELENAELHSEISETRREAEESSNRVAAGLNEMKSKLDSTERDLQKVISDKEALQESLMLQNEKDVSFRKKWQSEKEQMKEELDRMKRQLSEAEKREKLAKRDAAKMKKELDVIKSSLQVSDADRQSIERKLEHSTGLLARYRSELTAVKSAYDEEVEKRKTTTRVLDELNGRLADIKREHQQSLSVLKHENEQQMMKLINKTKRLKHMAKQSCDKEIQGDDEDSAMNIQKRISWFHKQLNDIHNDLCDTHHDL